MKKLLTFAVLGLVLSSCVKGFDGVEPEPTPEPTPNTTGVSEEDIKANVEKIFGTSFSPNQDWKSTTNGTVVFNINSDVNKVAIMGMISLLNEDNEAYTSMQVLNEAETNNQSSVSLSYDVPAKNEGLFAVFYTNKGCYYKKIEGNSVSFAEASAKTRTETESFKYPEGDFVIGKSEASWAAQRNWVPGELLYGLADDQYPRLKMDAPAYSDKEIDVLRAVIFSYFPNDKKVNNLPKVKATGYSDDNAYRITTGGAPIVVSPIYKRDGGSQYGNEVYNSELYYYYFKQADLDAAADPVAFLQALPKYKLIPFNIHFGEREDNVIEKRAAYAALYYGDETPVVEAEGVEGTKGSFTFPANYKIGFMVRANTSFKETKPLVDSENKPRKQGELYFDGRLNTKINSAPEFNFSSSQLGDGDPRATWFKVNNRILLCWESGTDTDFNDIILEVEGGVNDLDVIPEFEYNSYTFCFEDRQLGDYDMNDVVIKAVRKGETKVEYSIIACGAYDKLYVRNINSGQIKDDAEIHELFGKTTKDFINTVNGAEYCQPIKATVTVDKSFSFLEPSTQPYIYDETTGRSVYLSKMGEDPHGIMIPNDFKYPTEKTCIKDAYLDFNNWGINPVTLTDWYTKPVDGKVYTK